MPQSVNMIELLRYFGVRFDNDEPAPSPAVGTLVETIERIDRLMLELGVEHQLRQQPPFLQLTTELQLKKGYGQARFVAGTCGSDSHRGLRCGFFGPRLEDLPSPAANTSRRLVVALKRLADALTPRPTSSTGLIVQIPGDTTKSWGFPPQRQQAPEERLRVPDLIHKLGLAFEQVPLLDEEDQPTGNTRLAPPLVTLRTCLSDLMGLYARERGKIVQLDITDGVCELRLRRNVLVLGRQGVQNPRLAAVMFGPPSSDLADGSVEHRAAQVMEVLIRELERAETQQSIQFNGIA